MPSKATCLATKRKYPSDLNSIYIYIKNPTYEMDT